MLRPGHIALAIGVALAACGAPTPVFSGPSYLGDPPRPGPLNGLVVTTNNGDDTLSVVDPVTAQLRATIPLGFIPVELEGPHHIAADPSGAFLYVNLSEAVTGSGGGPHGAHGTGTIPGFLLKIRASDGETVASTQVDPNPGELTLSPDGTRAYVTHYDLLAWLRGAGAGDLRKGDSNLVVVDTASMEVKQKLPICPAAHGVRTSADGKTAFASCGPDEIAIVDVATGAVARSTLPNSTEGASCEHCPYALGIAPDGTVWVSTLGPDSGRNGGGAVFVYDPAVGAFDPARTITFCGRATFASFHAHDGGYTAYVPEQGPCGDAVHAYEVKDAVTTPGPVIALAPKDCVNAHMLEIAADGLTASLVCEGDHVGPGTFVKVDLVTHAPAVALPIGVFPDGLALVPAAR